ncbi:hypothetical protein [Bacillus atrophaeus]|uniref:hypothetical protein n=1 Tax=Bacillus atrophaeus TaxID=1452 RepID=UPI0022809E60|nr:hypothetical protein [Bacillus atrophaeus]MCY8915039.1 hypothetical protein [Bacillus atrophaeus]MEC0927853.1 hypothetical protein [Bacillus atrophaeus]
MEKGLLFFTLSLVAIWIILDDFYGGKHLSKMAKNMTPDINTPVDSLIETTGDVWDKAVDKAGEVKDKVSKDGEMLKDAATGKMYKDYKKAVKKNPKVKDAVEDSFWRGVWRGVRNGFHLG